MDSKERILEELKEKTKDKGDWAKVILTFGQFIYSFVEVILSFFKLILVIVFEISKLGVKISLLLLFLLFSLFFTGFVSKVNEPDILQQINLFNPIIILSASLAALTMTFYSIVKKEKVDEEKKKTLRFASEGFFWSTLFYLIALSSLSIC